MRKLVVVSVVAIVFLALGAGIALADDARIQRKSVPCYASGDDDLVQEHKGNGKQDEIILKRGNDLVCANRYTDDKDVVEGGLGSDKRDTANEGQGCNDACYVDAGSEAGQGCAAAPGRGGTFVYFVYHEVMSSWEGLSLPPGYRLGLDPDLLVLRRPDGSTVSVFGARGAVPECVETAGRRREG